ncbi:MAG: DUF3300 domain-containing protein [Betaproteobacteria bacterium]
MTTIFSARTCIRNSGSPRWMALVAVFAALVFAAQVMAQAPAATGGVASVPSAEALDKLVGRIALYPDDLVAVILPASTFPLEIVQAERYLQKRKSDPKLPLDDKWDDSVKTLLNYPDVVKSMSDDLDWTSDLGEAVVADQGAVLEAIQVFRRRTQSVGNLKSDDKQTVVVEKEVITIVPANPQVVYVPTYNPTTVVVAGGYSSYGYYPAPYPSYYYPYPPGAALATGLIWGAAIGAAWTGGRYGASYGGGNNSININRNTNITTGGNTNISNRSVSGTQRSGSASGQSSQWKSNKQPGQVSSGSGRSQSARVGDTGSRGGAAGAGGFGGSAGGARPSTQPAGGASNRGGGAFDGGGASGRQTQMDSSRGASSRASSPSASTRQSSAGSARSSGASAGARSSGGGARAGGGGGARGGGGRR